MKCDEILREVTDHCVEDGVATAEELPRALRDHLAQCEACAAEAEATLVFWHDLGSLEHEPPAVDEMRERFDVVLAAYRAGAADDAGATRAEARRAETGGWWRRWLPSATPLGLRPAAALLLLAVGFALGALLFDRGADEDVRALRDEVQALNETVTLSMLEDGSAAERLQGVSFGARVAHSDQRVLNALVHTILNDPSVNVRLAAIEAIAPLAAEPRVLQPLAQTLPEQESPIVQVALVDVLLESDGERAREAALELLSRRSLDPAVRRHVLRRLGDVA